MEDRERMIRRNQEELDRIRLEEEIEKSRYYEQKCGLLESEMKKQESAFNHQNEVLLDLLLKVKSDSTKQAVVSNNKNNKELKKNIEERVSRGLEYWKPIFDPKYYFDNNSDVATAIGEDGLELLRHYLTFGIYEGREGVKDFDLLTYMVYNPDLVDAFGIEIEKYIIHYAEFGVNEKRTCKK